MTLVVNIHIVCVIMSPYQIECVFHFVQYKIWGDASAEDNIQQFKKEAEKWVDKVKKNQEAISNIEKKREQYEGES